MDASIEQTMIPEKKIWIGCYQHFSIWYNLRKDQKVELF